MFYLYAILIHILIDSYLCTLFHVPGANVLISLKPSATIPQSEPYDPRCNGICLEHVPAMTLVLTSFKILAFFTCCQLTLWSSEICMAIACTFCKHHGLEFDQRSNLEAACSSRSPSQDISHSGPPNPFAHSLSSLCFSTHVPRLLHFRLN